MNLSSYSIKSTPIWKQVEKLSNKEKIDLITQLSISLSNTMSQSETPEQKTKHFVEKFAGSWTGNDSAEDIIDIINKGKKSHYEPLKF